MDTAQIDERGYRLGVGMVIFNQRNQVFWASRIDRKNAWQFPQGGIHQGEQPVTAMYRELLEEVGLSAQQVEKIAESKLWLSYDLPLGKQRVEDRVVVGQRQKWFLLRFTGDDQQINLQGVGQPEFNHWRWVDYWYPLSEVIVFKQAVYHEVLTEFVDYLKS